MILTFKMAKQIAQRNSVGETTYLWVVVENRVNRKTFYKVEHVKLAGAGGTTLLPENAVASYRDGQNWD